MLSAMLSRRTWPVGEKGADEDGDGDDLTFESLSDTMSSTAWTVFEKANQAKLAVI